MNEVKRSKKSGKPFTLKKKTVADLNNKEMNAIQGGVEWTICGTCARSCLNPCIYPVTECCATDPECP